MAGGNKVAAGKRNAFAVFRKDPSRVIEVPIMVCLQSSTTSEREVDENGIAVTREGRSFAGFKTLRDLPCHGAARFFERALSVRSPYMER